MALHSRQPPPKTEDGAFGRTHPDHELRAEYHGLGGFKVLSAFFP